MNHYFVPCSILLVVSFGINFSLFNAHSVFDNQRYLQVGALALVLLSFFDRKFFTFISIFVARHRITVGSMVAAASLAVCLSRFPYLASLESLNTLLLLFFALYLARCVSVLGKSFERITAVMLLFCFSLYYFQFFIGYFAGIFEGTSTKREVLVHHFSSVRYLNHLQALFLPYFFYLMLFAFDRRIRSAAGVVGVFTIIVMLYCSARGALLGSVIGLVCVCVSYRKTLPNIILMLFAFLLLSVLGYIALFEILPNFFGVESAAPSEVNTTSSSRLDMWIEVFYLSFEGLLFGLGPMHYGYYTEFGFGHPHNLVLQLLTDYGVLVLIAVIVCALNVVRALNRIYRQGGCGGAYLAWVSCLVSVSVLGLFSGVWVAPMTQLAIVFSLGKVLSPLFKSDQFMTAEAETEKPGFKMFLGISSLRLVLFCFLCFVWFATYSYNPLDGLSSGKPLFAPRFWQEMYWPAE